jgi:CRP/FNR family transcriptional regulator
VSVDELEEYCASRTERLLAPRDMIIKQGQPITEFIYLKEGLVKLFRDTTAGSQIISIGRPLDFVSLLSVFADEKYSYSVSALQHSTVCVFDLNEIKKMILENGAFAFKLIKTMNKASDRVLFNYLDINQKRLFGRVASVLLEFSNIYESNSYELPISRKEIAQLVGMSIENVIRTISDLRRDKIIRVYGKNLDIIDKRRLIQIRDLN